MKLSQEDKEDLLNNNMNDEFQSLGRGLSTFKKSNSFDDYLKWLNFMHELAGHPVRKPRDIIGETFLL